MNQGWLIPLIAYLLGSIPFGLLIVRARGGPDLREAGSGNIGAANAMRTGGLLAGILTLLLDGAKGFFAVWIAARLAHGDSHSVRWMMVAAVAAVIGHMFPVWLKLKGGKGVATTLGAFIPICLSAAIAAAVLWLLIVLFWRYTSLGSIVAAGALPLLLDLFYAPHHSPPTYVILGTILISILILLKHRSNMRRLVAGEENRLTLHR